MTLNMQCRCGTWFYGEGESIMLRCGVCGVATGVSRGRVTPPPALKPKRRRRAAPPSEG